VAYAYRETAPGVVMWEKKPRLTATTHPALGLAQNLEWTLSEPHSFVKLLRGEEVGGTGPPGRGWNGCFRFGVEGTNRRHEHGTYLGNLDPQRQVT